MRKIDLKRRKMISEILGVTHETIKNHLAEGRSYLSLFEYFDDRDLLEFIDSGKILRFDLFVNGESGQILKGALFKVDHGLDKHLTHPILLEAFSLMRRGHGNFTEEELLVAIDNTKGSFVTHANHRNIVKGFVKNYLTEEEIGWLGRHYAS
jgi:hypothetical protein